MDLVCDLLLDFYQGRYRVPEQQEEQYPTADPGDQDLRAENERLRATYDTLLANHEDLRQNCARLTAENERLKAIINWVDQ